MQAISAPIRGASRFSPRNRACRATSGTTATDSSGCGNDGVTVGGPVWWPFGGQIDGALQFDGINDQVDCGNGASLQIQGDMTLAIWIKPDTISGERGLASKWASSWCWVIGHDGMDLGKNAIYFNGWHAANTAVTVGAWSHLAVVYSDSADTAYFYLNGQPDGTATQMVDQGTGADLRIGARGDPGGSFFEGLIDDVRVYNRALSAAEISSLVGPLPSTITSTAPMLVGVGFLYSYTVVATGNPAPTFSVSGNPAWLTLTGNVLSGTPAAGDVGLTPVVTVTATNTEGSDQQSLQITVFAPGPPYLAYGTGGDVAVVDADGNLLYRVVPSETVNFMDGPGPFPGIGAGTVADPDPLNPTSNDFIIKGHQGGMARFAAGPTSATEAWVNDFPSSYGGFGMGDSIVYGPDGRIYRQHQWGGDASETVDIHDAVSGDMLVSDILGNNPGGGISPPTPAHLLVGGICFGLPGEAELANRLYVAWHTRPAVPADWGLVVAEFVNSSPVDLSGVWTEQMYDANGSRSGSGTHHFMESVETGTDQHWEILAMQWGYYGAQPTLYVVGKSDPYAPAHGWGGRYTYGADNVGTAPDNWMNVGLVNQCKGMQLGVIGGYDDRTAYVLHDMGGYGLQKWDMDDTDGNPFVATFAVHGGTANGSGVNIVGE